MQGAAHAGAEFLEFMRVCHKLKRTKRTGWVDYGVPCPESVCDHQYRMALMAMCIGGCDPDLDQARMMEIALVHDLAEAIVGDITPRDGVSKEEKAQREKQAMLEITSMLHHTMPTVQQRIMDRWLEYEHGTSAEGRVVKELDKLEMVIQAEEYESDTGIDLSQFFQGVEPKLSHATVKSWYRALQLQRTARKRADSTAT